MNQEVDKSKLEITDLRATSVKAKPFSYPIIKLYTNQEVTGLGELRDGADLRSALRFKSFLIGKNPLKFDKIYETMKEHTGILKYGWSGFGGRESGGISGIEVALLDIIGKVYEIPVYQLIGGKYRDKVRIYADTPTPSDPNPQKFAKKVLERKGKGFDLIKFDLGTHILKEVEKTGLLVGDRPTQKGINYLCSYLEAVREEVGWETQLALDHMGDLSIKDCKRVIESFEKFDLEWIEDPLPWCDIKGYRELTREANVPIMTGEGIFSLGGFKEILDQRAVDKIQPDLSTAGGIRETKRISDYANSRFIPTVLHCAGSPISFVASVHVAAATKNFVALENHALDIPWWKDLVSGLPDNFLKGGYVDVPEKPGVGIDIEENIVKKHLDDVGFFEPTPEWDSYEVFKLLDKYDPFKF